MVTDELATAVRVPNDGSGDNGDRPIEAVMYSTGIDLSCLHTLLSAWVGENNHKPGEDTLIKILEHFFSMALLYRGFNIKIL
eukprot:gene36249-44718_t